MSIQNIIVMSFVNRIPREHAFSTSGPKKHWLERQDIRTNKIPCNTLKILDEKLKSYKDLDVHVLACLASGGLGQ